MDLLQRVEQFVYYHHLFGSGARLVAAVSGGPDSVALLHLLCRMRRRWQLQLHVAHIHHGLRPQADSDAAFVARLADDVGVPSTIVKVDVRRERRGGESTQQAARRLRLGALRTVAVQVGADGIALGHHADDQAETVLLRLLRGTSTTGLGGMRPKRGPFIRPLLEIFRAEIEAYCRTNELDVLHDASNMSDAYARNRVRLHLLPQLAAEYNSNIVRRLAQTARLLQADDDVLDQLASQHYKEALVDTDHDDGARATIRLSVEIVGGLPYALRRRVVRQALKAIGVDLRLITFDHTDAVVRLVDDASDFGKITLPGRHTVERKGGVLFFHRPSYGGETDPVTTMHGASPTVVLVRPALKAARRLHIPGRTPVGSELVFETTFVPPQAFGEGGRTSLAEAWFDYTALVPPLTVRHRRDGDRMRPLGLGGTKKLQDLFVDEKVPRYVRDNVALVADARGIVWVPGLRMDERVAVRPHTERVLHVQIRSL